jgi:hypothetical protein
VLDAGAHRYVVPSLQAPQRYGYNIVRLYPDAGASSVTVTFRGVVQQAANTDYRWGLGYPRLTSRARGPTRRGA